MADAVAIAAITGTTSAVIAWIGYLNGRRQATVALETNNARRVPHSRLLSGRLRSSWRRSPQKRIDSRRTIVDSTSPTCAGSIRSSSMP